MQAVNVNYYDKFIAIECQFTVGSNTTGCQIDTINNNSTVSYKIPREGHHLTTIKYLNPLFENNTQWKAFGLKNDQPLSTEPAFTGMIIFPPQIQPSKQLKIL